MDGLLLNETLDSDFAELDLDDHKERHGGPQPFKPTHRVTFETPNGARGRYEYYSFTKAQDWRVADRIKIAVPQDELGKTVAKWKKKTSVREVLTKMSPDRRAQVNRLLDEKNLGEENKDARWECVFIESPSPEDKHVHGKIIREHRKMNVIVAQYIRPGGTSLSALDRSKSFVGERSDISEPLKPTHKAKDKHKQSEDGKGSKERSDHYKDPFEMKMLFDGNGVPMDTHQPIPNYQTRPQPQPSIQIMGQPFVPFRGPPMGSSHPTGPAQNPNSGCALPPPPPPAPAPPPGPQQQLPEEFRDLSLPHNSADGILEIPPPGQGIVHAHDPLPLPHLRPQSHPLPTSHPHPHPHPPPHLHPHVQPLPTSHSHPHLHPHPLPHPLPNSHPPPHPPPHPHPNPFPTSHTHPHPHPHPPPNPPLQRLHFGDLSGPHVPPRKQPRQALVIQDRPRGRTYYTKKWVDDDSSPESDDGEISAFEEDERSSHTSYGDDREKFTRRGSLIPHRQSSVRRHGPAYREHHRRTNYPVEEARARLGPRRDSRYYDGPVDMIVERPSRRRSSRERREAIKYMQPKSIEYQSHSPPLTPVSSSSYSFPRRFPGHVYAQRNEREEIHERLPAEGMGDKHTRERLGSAQRRGRYLDDPRKSRDRNNSHGRLEGEGGWYGRYH